MCCQSPNNLALLKSGSPKFPLTFKANSRLQDTVKSKNKNKQLQALPLNIANMQWCRKNIPIPTKKYMIEKELIQQEAQEDRK